MKAVNLVNLGSCEVHVLMKEARGWQVLAGMIEMIEGDECIPHWKGSEKTELKVPVILCPSVIATWMNL